MDARVPIIVKDPEVTKYKEIPATEPYTIRNEEVLLDGPVSTRVAVIDFDAETGALAPGAIFERSVGDEPGTYRLADPSKLAARDVTQVSVFGTVLKTMAMFEEPDALGRRLAWAFDAPQLLVVPRAGDWANAFYERESHSLQFFHFRPFDGGKTIFTCHSQDIVAHETAHAILDGIAPALYHATSPQSLAIHEAVADLTALLMAFRSRPLRERVLQDTEGRIQESSAFSGIAEQFGQGLEAGRTYLRDLLNNKSLARDALPADQVDRSEPHSLSEVLSGALYTVMVQLHESLKDEYALGARPDPVVDPAEAAFDLAAQGEGDGEPPAPQPLEGEARKAARARVSGKALAVAAERFKRTLFRGLDYLPPGEASFADLARAMIAADEASHPESGAQREWIRNEFLRRGIVARRRELEVKANYPHPAVAALDLATLVESDWAAYDFANRNRELLRIPKDVSFHVYPRLDVTKRYYHRGGTGTLRECLFKVSWSESERNAVGSNLPGRRQVTVGTTLAIDWDTGQIRACLTSNRSAEQRADRDRLLTRLLDEGYLRLGDEALGPDGKPLCTAIRAETLDGQMRVRGVARMLHIQPQA